MYFFQNLEIFDVTYRIFGILNGLYLRKYNIDGPETAKSDRKNNFRPFLAKTNIVGTNYPKTRKDTNFQKISEIRRHLPRLLTK